MSSFDHLVKKPLHMQKGKKDLIAKSSNPSTRPVGDKIPSNYRNPSIEGLVRFDGNTPLRRYGDGTLDVAYVGTKVLEALDRVRATGVGSLNNIDCAMLSLLVPGCSFTDKAIARIMIRLSDLEVLAIQKWLEAKLESSAHWNAGQGSGIWPGDFADVNKGVDSGLDDIVREVEKEFKGVGDALHAEGEEAEQDYEHGMGVKPSPEDEENAGEGEPEPGTVSEDEFKAGKLPQADTPLGKSLVHLMDLYLKA